MLTKKTKIICTMGPATDDDEVLKDLMRSGMDILYFKWTTRSY